MDTKDMHIKIVHHLKHDKKWMLQFKLSMG